MQKGGEGQGKYAPHQYAHARPWDTFKPKVVSKKQVSLLQITKPGHKANPALGEDLPSSSGAYGCFAPQTRAPAVAASRRAYGRYALEDEDVLGPVDLSAERAAAAALPPPQRPSSGTRRTKEEPPPDTLRWNDETGRGGRGGLAAEARRKAAEALAESEAAEAAAAASKAASQQGGHPGTRMPPKAKQSLTLAPGAPAEGVRTEKGMKYEMQMRARQKVEAEKAEKQRAHDEAVAAAMAAGPQFHHRALADPKKVEALTDPRVTAALQAKLNAPNALSAEQYKSRNTTRVSAERKF